MFRASLFPARTPKARADQILTVLLVGTTALAAGLVLWILFFVGREALSALLHVGPGRFITDSSWHPVNGLFRMTPMVAATLAITIGSILIAGPLGLAGGVYLRFFAGRRTGTAFRRLVELLAGIPSVIYGLWGLTTLVPWLAQIQAPGMGLAAACFILSIMILPTVTLTTDTALGSVEPRWLEGAAALGLDRTGTALFVAVPAARGGIAAGWILATARALGETMAVLMVAGNVVRMPSGLFESIRPLTANIALEMGYAGSDHRSVLFASGLVLMILVSMLVIVGSYLEPEPVDG